MVTEDKQKNQELTLSIVREFLKEHKLSMEMIEFNDDANKRVEYAIVDNRYPYVGPYWMVIEFDHYRETGKFVITDYYVRIGTRIRNEDNKVIDVTALYEQTKQYVKELYALGFLTVGKKI